LLTPDNRKRIKVKEIFSHPWVIEMENEIKEDMRKNSEKTLNSTSTAADSTKALMKHQSQPIIPSKFK